MVAMGGRAALAVLAACVLGTSGCSPDRQTYRSTDEGRLSSVTVGCFLAQQGLVGDTAGWLSTAWVPQDHSWQYEVFSVVVPEGCEVTLTDGSQVVLNGSSNQSVLSLVVGKATVAGDIANGGNELVAREISLALGDPMPAIDGPPPALASGVGTRSSFILTGDAYLDTEEALSDHARWLRLMVPGIGNDEGSSAEVVQYAVVDASTEVRRGSGRVLPIDDILASGLGDGLIWATVEFEELEDGVRVRRMEIAPSGS